MRLRRLITGLALLSTIAGCDNDIGIPGAATDGGRGDGATPVSFDLALANDPCKAVVPSGTLSVLSRVFAGSAQNPLPLGGDGTMERDLHVARDAQGGIVLGSSGGLPEVKGSYFVSMDIDCRGPCKVRRIGWDLETPPNTWVNVATRIGSFANLDGGGWTPRGGVTWVDVEQAAAGLFQVQWDAELFSGANDAGSPALRRFWTCWEN